MKKNRLMLLAASLVTAFTFTSCLDEEENNSMECMSLVTIENYAMYPDEYPQQSLMFYGDRTQYGISASATRALVTYSAPVGTDWTAPSVDVTLISGQDWPVSGITDVNYADTCSAYTSPIIAFSGYGVGSYLFPSVNVVRDRYLNVGYTYQANKKADVVLIANRASNDTIYLDFKIKKEGSGLSSGSVMNSFDLDTAYRLMSAAVKKNDSLYVTVVASTSSDYQEAIVEKDSVTTRFKY